MDDDWASGGEDEPGLGDISAIPQVKIPEQAPKPVESSQILAPPINAWKAKPSDDVRKALPASRPQSQPRQPHTPTIRQQRRHDLPTAIAGNSERTERSNSRPNPASAFSRPTTLYVTNIPYDASENSLTSFFENQGVRVISVRIIRHSDTGNIKAAFVRIPPEQDRQHALSVNGRKFGSRNVNVKVDGTEGNRRRDRGGSLGNISFGGNYGTRERRENSGNGWNNGQWGDRPSLSADAVDRRMAESRDDRRRDASQLPDPTIPTGPPPAGRKKLQLKPRTKPLPVLEVDMRAIDSPRAPTSAPPPVGHEENRILSRGGSGSGLMKISSSENPNKVDKSNKPDFSRRSGKPGGTQNGGDSWTAARESGATRQANANPSSSKKEDGSKRPVLLNAFSALEVNDLDA